MAVDHDAASAAEKRTDAVRPAVTRRNADAR